MAQQYVGLNRGQAGMKRSDFTSGTSSTAGLDFEFRFNDAVNVTRQDIIIALERISEYYRSHQTANTPKL